MIGVRAHDFGRQKIEELPVILKEAGYDAAQLALPRAFAEIESYEAITLDHLMKIRRAFEDNLVKIPVFSCYQDLSNPDEEIRKKAVDTIKICLSFSKEAGACAVGTETSWPTLSAEEKKIRHPYMIDSLLRIVEEAQRVDAVLAVEPVHRHPLENLEVMQEVIDAVNDPVHLRIIFDPSNLLKDPEHTEQDLLWSRWLESVGMYVDALHIKDFVPDKRAENEYRVTALGEGVMKYDSIAKWLRVQKREIALIRDEADVKWTQQDLAYIKRELISG